MSETRVISLGCRLNHAESERIAALVEAQPDLVVVNSCSVTREAVRHTRQAIRRARKARPGARLLVTGCAAETEREALGAMDEVDGFVANQAKLDARSWNVPEPRVALRQQGTRAFIGVQNGCDHACTFCSIPAGRGTSRSDDIATVLRAVEARLIEGTQEVVLTGVDLTSWGHDLPGEPRLGALVAAILAEFPQLPRLRLSSVDGIEIDDALFELIAGEPRVMPHLHLSLQHGSDLILKRMKRRHLRSDAIDLVARLKARRPEIAIGADLIAGFPTETDAHHADNLSIVAECGIVHGHIFPYSPRAATPAARMPQVNGKAIKDRARRLREAGDLAVERHLSAQVGRTHQVLLEAADMGRTEQFTEVSFATPQPVGQIVEVAISGLRGGQLVAAS